VTVQMKGDHEIISLKIDPEFVSEIVPPRSNPAIVEEESAAGAATTGARLGSDSPSAAADIEMLQDMIVAAINEGNRKVNEAMKSKLGSMLPPGLGNLF